jgi:hypothetical protein
MSVEVSTCQFIFSHGHYPRGRGSWAFFFGSGPRDLQSKPIFCPGQRTYSEARKWAVSQARLAGCAYVEVGS